MRRFERELNGARRFWEIDLQGERLRFHTGEVGRAGRVRTSVQRTPEAAAVELNRAVAEMVAGGWEEVLPRVEPAAPPPRPELIGDPDDPSGYLVLGDQLQAAGDPRGELIAVQAALAAGLGDEGALRAEEARLLAAHGPALLGPLHRREEPWEVRWFCGFFAELHLESTGFGSDAAGLVEELAALGALALLRGLRVSAVPSGSGVGSSDPLAFALARRSWPLLRELALGGPLTVPLATPLGGMPRLERLALEDVATLGPVDLSRLTHLVIGIDDPLALSELSALPAPALRELELRGGHPDLDRLALRRVVERPLERLTLGEGAIGPALASVSGRAPWARLAVRCGRGEGVAEALLAASRALEGVPVELLGELPEADLAALAGRVDARAALPDVRVSRDTLHASPRQEVPRRFQRVKGGAVRFWEIVREGAWLITKHGAAGHAGTTNRRGYADPESAAGEYRKRVRQKLAEGWAEAPG